jgi:lysophospholipase L1-like esterase
MNDIRRHEPKGSTNGIWRMAGINLLVFLLLLAIAEGGTRVFIHFTRGDSTASIAERTQYLIYQPFVMFGPEWDTKLTLSRYPPRSDPAGRPYRILLLGASVADGFPQEALVKTFSERLPGRDIQVMMAASGGYVARQELIVASIWGPSLQPDLIITFDGGNDLDLRLRVDKPGTFSLNPTYELMLTKPFLAPVAYLLSQSQTYNGIRRLAARYQIGPVELYEDAIPVYVSAQHSINILAKGLSANRLMVLEPFAAFKVPLSDAEASLTHFKYREPVMKELYGRTHEQLTDLARKDHVAYLDARFLFEGIRDTIFRDDVHFADHRGYRLLAKAMANCLREVPMDEHSCQTPAAGR